MTDPIKLHYTGSEKAGNKNVKIDIDTETVLPEEDIPGLPYVTLLNVFQCYYKATYGNSTNENLFTGIVEGDKSKITNRSTELLYEILFDHKENTKKGKEYIEIYDTEEIDETKYEHIYGVMIDNDIMVLSPDLYRVLVYVGELENWYNIEWKIIKIK